MSPGLGAFLVGVGLVVGAVALFIFVEALLKAGFGRDHLGDGW